MAAEGQGRGQMSGIPPAIRTNRTCSSRSVIVVRTLFASLIVALVPALLEAPWTAAMTPSSLWAIVYYAIVPTVGGYLLWYAGLARVAGAEAAL
ncbi:MAG: EamA family transporter, partial [Mesorhizobium sp.]|nr:EamA family transporter [Mesorhizobium sp.]